MALPDRTIRFHLKSGRVVDIVDPYPERDDDQLLEIFTRLITRGLAIAGLAAGTRTPTGTTGRQVDVVTIERLPAVQRDEEPF